MAEQVVTYALTTKARIKNILGIDDAKTGQDTVIERYISSVTDWLERTTNRRFKRTSWLLERYTIGGIQDFLILKQAPLVSIEAFAERSGLPNNPTWTAVPTTDYEILDDGEQGIIQIHWHPAKGTIFRVSYTAGYLIDFANAGTATHTLPHDLSALAEKLVVKAFKKREKPGLGTESFEGTQITWEKELDAEDKETIANHRRTIFI